MTKAFMLESQIQREIITWLEKHGWLVTKIIQCNKNGWPDLQCIRNFPEHAYIEVKRPGLKPDPLQEYRIEKLRKLGWTAFVATSVEDVKYLS